MTVLEAIQRSADFLQRKEVDSPRLQAELLLAHVLSVPRMKLYLSFDRGLTAAEADSYRALVQRRGQREPLQHIVGSVQFHGVELAVNRDVLIPRPETELLVEQAVLRIPPAPTRVLDFGTGSGCIAIAIAAACPPVTVVGVDLSPAAVAMARANAKRNGVDGRVEFLESDGLAAVPAEPPFDLLVSNPPYIASEEIATLQPEVRDHDPVAALDGGPDGLDFYRLLASQAGRWLTPNGTILLEFGDGQGPAIAGLFADAGWQTEPLVRDYSGRDRILIARRSR